MRKRKEMETIHKKELKDTKSCHIIDSSHIPHEMGLKMMHMCQILLLRVIVFESELRRG